MSIQFETFSDQTPIQVGHIVMLPDGRAGEVMAVGEYPAVRAWDENTAYEFEKPRLQPWEEVI